MGDDGDIESDDTYKKGHSDICSNNFRTAIALYYDEVDDACDALKSMRDNGDFITTLLSFAVLCKFFSSPSNVPIFNIQKKKKKNKKKKYQCGNYFFFFYTVFFLAAL